MDTIAEEHDRWKAVWNGKNFMSGTVEVGVLELLDVHFALVQYFADELDSKGIGGVGPREKGLVESTLGRQWAGFGGRRFWSNKFEVVATLFYGVVKNHAFHDANKRTAVLCLLFQLVKNGRSIRFDQKSLEELALRTASSELALYPRFQKFQDTANPEVAFIADWLRRNTEVEDHTKYRVTYRELSTILGNHGYALVDPKGNKITVCKKRKRNFLDKLIGGGKESSRLERVTSISFPGWSREVPNGEIKHIRSLLELDEKHGVDSGVFFKGVTTLRALLPHYHKLLLRLADK